MSLLVRTKFYASNRCSRSPDPVFLNFPVQRLAGDIQVTGRFGFVVARFLQGLENGFLFKDVQVKGI